MKPRAVQRKQTQSQPPTASTSPRPPAPAPAPPPPKPVTATPTATEDGLNAKYSDLLYTLEWFLSNYGLSLYFNADLLPLLSQSQDGLIHLQSLLLISPLIKSFAKSINDLQKALALSNPTSSLELSEDGFKVRRRVQPDYQKLLNMDLNDWEDHTIYLVCYPFPFALQPLLMSINRKTFPHLHTLLGLSIPISQISSKHRFRECSFQLYSPQKTLPKSMIKALWHMSMKNSESGYRLEAGSSKDSLLSSWRRKKMRNEF